MAAEEVSPAPAQSPPQAPAARSRWRTLLVGIAIFYCASIGLLWPWMYLEGERSWLAALLLYGPRWICAIPLPLLGVAAALFARRLMWIVAAAAIVVAGPILGFVVHLPTVGAPQPTFRVLTCNVHQNDVNTESLAEMIAADRPDVVALQEVSSATHFAWPSDWHVLNRDEFTLASRWPVVERERIYHGFRRLHDPLAIRYSIERPEGETQVFAVHLQSPRPGLDAVLTWLAGRGGLGTARFDEILEIRTVEADQLSRWIAGFAGAKIILGDFNMPVESTIYRQCFSSLDNAFSAVGWGLGFTKITQKQGFSYGTRIDHVLFSDGWRPGRSWVGRDVNSDHLPLLAEFD